MRELNAILDAWRAHRQAPGVLATVLHVEGSAYRRPGARMWIPQDSRARIGTISGGCLEGDVAKKAAWWTAHGEPVVRVYDTMSDEEAVWEFGLGCNGIIHVLLERVESRATQAMLEYLDEAQRARRPVAMGTVLRAAPGGPYAVGDHLYGGPQAFPGLLAAAARETLALRRSRLVHLPQADVFVEYIAPPQRLVVFGAGHDVMPVVAQATALGWETTVADVRSGYAKPERFPGASRVAVLPGSGALAGAGIEIDADTAVVVMTHNLQLDARLLPQLLRARPAYLGMLGPRKRLARVSEEAGCDPAATASLHAPAGLDLGGDTPEAIALSIISEIQAVLHQSPGRSLRWNTGAIHAPAIEVGRPAPQLEPVQLSPIECEVVHG